jgi:transcriptional regulator with XRE-family HTH domain
MLYGRGSGTPHPIDVHVGSRVRMRRQLLGMNQERLASALGITFQQVQKYENGHNRISASRLAAIAQALDAPITFFFADLPTAEAPQSAKDLQRNEWLGEPETINLIRYYYAIPDDGVRREFLAMVKAAAKSVKHAQVGS